MIGIHKHITVSHASHDCKIACYVIIELHNKTTWLEFTLATTQIALITKNIIQAVIRVK